MPKKQHEELRDLVDLIEAAEESEEEFLTWIELATALGVEPKEDGDLDGIELFNACLNAQGNPKVKQLSHNERIRVIRSAAAALSALQSGNLG